MIDGVAKGTRGLFRIPVDAETIEYFGMLQDADPSLTPSQVFTWGIDNWGNANRQSTTADVDTVTEDSQTFIA